MLQDEAEAEGIMDAFKPFFQDPSIAKVQTHAHKKHTHTHTHTQETHQSARNSLSSAPGGLARLALSFVSLRGPKEHGFCPMSGALTCLCAPVQVWHNFSFDRHVLNNHNVECGGLAGDTIHMARMYDASRLQGGGPGYGLEALSSDPKVMRRKDSEAAGVAKKTGMKEIFEQPVIKKDGTEVRDINRASDSPILCRALRERLGGENRRPTDTDLSLTRRWEGCFLGTRDAR